MTSCRHQTIELLPAREKRLRCLHCHLTIKPDELQGGYCPECFEEHGVRRRDFEELAAPAEERNTRYRCDDCGAIIEAD